MWTVWLLLACAWMASCASAETRAALTSDKDLYLDNSSIEEASGVYPIDDDDYTSGSGSGDEEEGDNTMIDSTSRMPPERPVIPASDAPRTERTTLKTQTKSPEEIDKKKILKPDAENKNDKNEPGEDADVFTQKHSENLFQRTEVLAAVIAGGVIGFLFAIFLILLLVYRMRKKDEGSYDLGERKPSSAAYQKAPTKEFYA
ncbi:syndecan-2 isoform X2 [Sceloporus undulatus]|uniref:syndecan-2 isoform X2 n=1 Tax=Sceloporus undulatus TaxID=8520 RepID=UPI001C4C11F0|nr:syndecan-2 isoform X2 [Sceloporus undulatus]